MAIRDMTRKKQRRPDSTESSSSGEMVSSKQPSDVLELGQHLVRELGFHGRGNTLGRWMSHHLAEIMTEAKKGATRAQRLKARKEAMDTIIGIWEHRKALPENAYPLAQFKDVLKVIDVLRPGRSPFVGFGRYAETRIDGIAATLFDNIVRLIIALLLMKLHDTSKPQKANPAAIKALTPTERRVLTALQQWTEFLAVADNKPGEFDGPNKAVSRGT